MNFYKVLYLKYNFFIIANNTTFAAEMLFYKAFQNA